MVLTIYDIVKAHGRTITVNTFNSPKVGPSGSPPGGELKVETATAKEDEGSTFIIQLPMY